MRTIIEETCGICVSNGVFFGEEKDTIYNDRINGTKKIGRQGQRQ